MTSFQKAKVSKRMSRQYSCEYKMIIYCRNTRAKSKMREHKGVLWMEVIQKGGKALLLSKKVGGE